MQTIKPANGFVFAKPDEAETKTASGLLLTEEAAERPRTATIINSAVDGYQRDDRIVYKSYTSNDIKLNGEEYIILDKRDILGVVLNVKN